MLRLIRGEESSDLEENQRAVRDPSKKIIIHRIIYPGVSVPSLKGEKSPRERAPAKSRHLASVFSDSLTVIAT